jgi:hypothetical protein
MRSARQGQSNIALPYALEVTVRRATHDDGPALARLAALDCSSVPSEPVLLAEVDGTAMAAISIADGHVVADPFERTADLVELLRVRAAQSSREPAATGTRRLGLGRRDAAPAHSIANQT